MNRENDMSKKSVPKWFSPKHGESEEIEAILVIDAEEEWTIPWASGRPADVAWLHNDIADMSVRDALEVDDRMQKLEPGRYRVRLTLEWSCSPSTPDSPEEYDGWTNIVSVTKEENTVNITPKV